MPLLGGHGVAAGWQREGLWMLPGVQLAWWQAALLLVMTTFVFKYISNLSIHCKCR